MRNILFIDTSKTDETLVGISLDGVKKEIKDIRDSTRKRKSQTLLLLVDKILKENDLALKDLAGIQVNAGPGSFTGLRVGVSVANSLAQVLGIPINGKSNQLVEPIYA